MTEYGIWDDHQAGVITAQMWSEAEANEELTRLRADDYAECPEEVSVVEICPDHEGQPKHGCDECED